MIHSPILHDIIKAILTYKAKEMWKTLQLKKPDWKIFKNWELIKVYQEYLEDRKKLDVVWIIKHKTKQWLNPKKIIHEIKTTKIIDVQKCWEKYRVPRGHLFIWKWRKAKVIVNSEEIKRRMRSGWIRILNIEILKPFLIGELENLLQKLKNI